MTSAADAAAREDGPRQASGEADEIPEQRRVLRVLAVAQLLSGAGLAAGITVGALLAEEMLGSERLAGLPTALFTGGAALGAVAVGRISQRWGRRPGLTFGYAVAALGSLAVVAAAALDSVPLLFGALLVYGAGTATTLQARYAGADLAAPERRGRAAGTVLFATTLGAVVGPNLTSATGSWAESWGLTALAGPFLLAALAYAAASVTLAVALRPDPLLLATELAAGARAGGDEGGDAGGAGKARGAASSGAGAVPGAAAEPGGLVRRGVAAGAGVMILTQLVMIAVMTMTPVHMSDHGHGTQATGLVIGLHVGAMYLPSPLTGRLVDRYGPVVVAGVCGPVLLLAGVLAALVPAHSTAGLALALVLLGLGWNLGLVSGTALLTGSLPVTRRAATQGSVDVGISIAGATGGLLSGLVVSAGSYAVLGLSGALLALACLPLVLVLVGPRRAAAVRGR